MKKERIRLSLPLLFVAGFALFQSACTTTEPVRSESISSALDFSDIERIEVDVDDTRRIDTAFDRDMRETAVTTLIDALEEKGFAYVGKDEPEIEFTFNTYPVRSSGYVDTNKPVSKRVITQKGVTTEQNEFIPTETDQEIHTSDTSDPIYVEGASRLFVLDINDADSKAHLFRAYSSHDGTGLDQQTLIHEIHRLVDEFDESQKL